MTEINLEARYVRMNGSMISYDYLVIAVGVETNFFGMDSIQQDGFQVKDIQKAVSTRNHLLNLFEQANHEADADKRRAMLTFVVVGGGPTGVETAGALAELINHVMVKDFPNLNLNESRVILLEANDHLITPYPHESRREQVEILLNSKLADFNGQIVTLRDGRQIATQTLIWTAGVKAAPLLDSLGVERAGAGRVQVTPTLQLPQYPEVFILGFRNRILVFVNWAWDYIFYENQIRLITKE